MSLAKGFILVLCMIVTNLRPAPRKKARTGRGSALTLKERQEDVDIIREIGANTVRLTHHQHAQEFYGLCDENGLIVWAEIPYITQHMSNGRENTLSQMRELVIQNYNHPSIVCWGSAIRKAPPTGAMSLR